MEIREKMLWQIANTVMVNHQFIDTPEFCAEQAEASLLLFKVSQRLDIDIYRDFALRCFERCVSQLPKISQKVTAAGWAICRILNEGWTFGDMDAILHDVDKRIFPVLNRDFDFGDETKGNFILPHFYLLERHKKDKNYWTTQSDMIQNLKASINRHTEKGGVFSILCQESIDRFLLHAGVKTVFADSYPDTLYALSPEELTAQAWRSLLYGQRIAWTFSEKELADYIDRRIADFDATEDLNLQGILSIGLII